MDIVLEALENSGFSRTNSQITLPLVVHAVPGSGKTTLIRNLLAEYPEFTCITFGVPDYRNLENRRIQAPHEITDLNSQRFLLVDEYTEGEIPSVSRVLFGDPFQSSRRVQVAHFVNSNTRRFGKSTCAFLKKFGYNVTSDKEDKVSFGGLYETDPIGQIVCFEPDVEHLLRAHDASYITHCQARGKTYRQVTLCVSDLDIKEGNRHKFYICCTRHTEELLVLSLNAAFTPSRLF